MPGFNIAGSPNPNEPRSLTEIRRKHRWLFTTFAPDNLFQGVLLFLQKASRPNFKYEEPVMHHDQEQIYYAGKQSWEPITISFYDAEQNPNVSLEIHRWVRSVTTSGLQAGQPVTVAPPVGYKRDATLESTDGAGIPTESWELKGCWPKETNWGDLDYTNTDLQMVEVTFRFDRAIRTL